MNRPFVAERLSRDEFRRKIENAYFFNEKVHVPPSVFPAARKMLKKLDIAYGPDELTQTALLIRNLNMLYVSSDEFLILATSQHAYSGKDRTYKRLARWFIEKLIPALERNGVMQKYHGYKTKNNEGHKRRRSRQRISWDAYFDMCGPMERDAFVPIPHLVAIRPHKGKKKAASPNKEVIAAHTEWLERHNDFMWDHAAFVMETHNGREAWSQVALFLYTIYTGDWETNGRLHTCRYGYQHFSKAKRVRMFLDMEPVVEIDFPTFYANLCYALAGKTPPSEDSYLAVVNGDPALRELGKGAFLISINTKNEFVWAGAVKGMLENADGKLHHLLPAFQVSGLSLGDLQRNILIYHKRIERFIYSSAWRTLMYKERTIIMAVTDHFMNEDIPVLNVHDSCIAQRRFAPFLAEVMEKKYAEVTGGSIEVELPNISGRTKGILTPPDTGSPPPGEFPYEQVRFG